MTRQTIRRRPLQGVAYGRHHEERQPDRHCHEHGDVGFDVDRLVWGRTTSHDAETEDHAGESEKMDPKGRVPGPRPPRRDGIQGNGGEQADQTFDKCRRENSPEGQIRAAQSHVDAGVKGGRTRKRTTSIESRVINTRMPTREYG